MDTAKALELLHSIRSGFVEIANRNPGLLLQCRDEDGVGQYEVRRCTPEPLEDRFVGMCGRLGGLIRQLNTAGAVGPRTTKKSNEHLAFEALMKAFESKVHTEVEATGAARDGIVVISGTLPGTKSLVAAEHSAVEFVDILIGRCELDAERPQDLITFQQAADAAKISERTIRRWVSGGSIAEHRLGQLAVVSRAEVLEKAPLLIQRRRVAVAKKAGRIPA